MRFPLLLIFFDLSLRVSSIGFVASTRRRGSFLYTTKPTGEKEDSTPNDWFPVVSKPPNSHSASKLNEQVDDSDKLSILSERLFDALLGESGSFHTQQACKDHMQLVLSLIRTDVQSVDAEDMGMTIEAMNEEKKLFPSSYKFAADYIDKVFDKLGEISHPALIAAKFIRKKEGLPHQFKGFMTVREIVESKRKIERCLSLLLVLLIGHKSSQHQGPEVSKDLLFFSRIVLERVPVHERHFTLLLLCRGIIAPPFAVKNLSQLDDESLNVFPASKTRSNKRQEVLETEAKLRELGSSYYQSFSQGMRSEGVEQPSSSARLLFPFLSFSLRNFWLATQRQRAQSQNQNLKSSDDLFDEPELDRGYSQQSTSAPDVVQVEYDGDLQLCRLIGACMWLDRQTERVNGLTGAGDELLHSLRRWATDWAAGHLIAEYEKSAASDTANHGSFVSASRVEDGSTNAQSRIPPPSLQSSHSLPEELRRNTVAMELISANRAFSLGRHADRTLFDASQAHMGAQIASIASLFANFQLPLQEGDKLQGSSMSSSSSYSSLSSTSDLQIQVEDKLATAKKAIAAISALRALPTSSRLRRRFMIEALSNRKAIDDLQTSYDRDRETYRDADNSDDLWGLELRRRPSVRFRPAAAKPTSVIASAHSSSSSDLFGFPVLLPLPVLRDPDHSLLLLFGEMLRVDPDALAANSAVRSEMQYIFATWRRPILLLDYLRMHSVSSPPVEQLFRRFLQALLGIGNPPETVEDIRSQDPGNRAMLSRFPPKLVNEWVEGRTSRGDVLPGYNDAQTLFMLGEDSSTCMMVRPRQKGTNRGLLSRLLHGNVRVLGRKDSSGRLLERAVVLLAIDQTTQRPVLFVETPMSPTGSGNGPALVAGSAVEVYDQAAELGRLLSLPVIYAVAPDPCVYAMGPGEVDASGRFDQLKALAASATNSPSFAGAGAGTGTGVSVDVSLGIDAGDGDQDIESIGSAIDLYDGAWAWLDEDGDALHFERAENDNNGDEYTVGPDSLATSNRPSKSTLPPPTLSNISDYTNLSPYVWVDGITDVCTGRFFPGRTPLLTKRSSHGTSIGTDDIAGVTIGVRPVGALERVTTGSDFICGPPVFEELPAQKQQRESQASPADEAFRKNLSKLARSAGPMMRRGSSAGAASSTPPATGRRSVTSSASYSEPTNVSPSSNSMIAKLIERNRMLADRTKRSFRAPLAQVPDVPEPQDQKIFVNEKTGEVTKNSVASNEDRFSGEKDPTYMPIFEDDSDDLFA